MTRRLENFGKNVAAGVLITGFFAIAIGTSIGTMQHMPDKALLYIDHDKKEYVSPPCIEKGEAAKSYTITVGGDLYISPHIRKERYHTVKSKGYRGDERCVNGSGFFTQSRSWLVSYFWPAPYRWDENGEWLW